MKITTSSLTNDLKKLFAKQFKGVDPTKIQAYTYIILTLFTVSFFGVFAIGPTLNTITNLNKQYEDSVTTYDALNKKLSALAALDAQYQSQQDDIDLIYAAIPKSSQIPQLTRQIETLAQNNNLKVVNLTFGTIEIYPNIKADPIYSFTFTVDVTGNETNVNKFVADMINFDRIIGVDIITTGVDQDKQYNLSLTGRAFFAVD